MMSRKTKMTILLVKFAIVLGLILLFNVASAGEPVIKNDNKTMTLTGKVVDKYTNEPLAGVLIKNNNIQIYTDLDGNFTINNFEYGTYINIELISYKNDSILINDSNVEIKIK